jgi:hypothetical protein
MDLNNKLKSILREKQISLSFIDVIYMSVKKLSEFRKIEKHEINETNKGFNYVSKNAFPEVYGREEYLYKKTGAGQKTYDLNFYNIFIFMLKEYLNVLNLKENEADNILITLLFYFYWPELQNDIDEKYINYFKKYLLSLLLEGNTCSLFSIVYNSKKMDTEEMVGGITDILDLEKIKYDISTIEENVENFRRRLRTLYEPFPTKEYIEKYNKKTDKFFKKKNKNKINGVLCTLNGNCVKSAILNKNYKKRNEDAIEEFLNKYKIKKNKYCNLLDLYGITGVYQPPTKDEMIVNFKGFEDCGIKDGTYIMPFKDTSKIDPILHPKIKNQWIIKTYYIYFAQIFDLYKLLLPGNNLGEYNSAAWFDYQAENLEKKLLLFNSPPP